jgi:Niemann-Pick C1-like protein 1
MAHAKLWEEAFLKEMQSFQRSTADKFQIAFSAEVGALQSPWFYACNP